MRSASAPTQRPAAALGFTLVEMAVVLAIVGLLLGTVMFTLSAQVETRDFEETRRRLDHAKELLLSYAIVHGRLPCPATTSGEESPLGGGTCTAPFTGYLPAKTIGFTQVNGAGFAVDAWKNPIRYAVAPRIIPSTGGAPSVSDHFTNSTTLRTNGTSWLSSDLELCTTSTYGTSSASGTAPASCPIDTATSVKQAVVRSGMAAALVFSTGKNGKTSEISPGADEAWNLKISAPYAGGVFIWHTPTPSTATYGEFDDQFVWITPGELYGKLISAGLLP